MSLLEYDVEMAPEPTDGGRTVATIAEFCEGSTADDRTCPNGEGRCDGSEGRGRMSDDDRRNAVVSLAVYPNTKEEWESAVRGDPDADTLSQLICVVVSRYIHERSSGSNRGVSEEFYEQLTELNTQQERLARHMDEIKGQLTDIREAVINQLSSGFSRKPPSV